MNKHLLTIIIAFLLTLNAIGIFTSTKRVADNYYPTTAVVTEVNHTDSYIVATNHSRTFILYGAEDWHEGDYISILMDRKHTVQIIDDEIVTYYYTDMERTEDSIWVVHMTQP
jgi:hypothetical protein